VINTKLHPICCTVSKLLGQICAFDRGTSV